MRSEDEDAFKWFEEQLNAPSEESIHSVKEAYELIENISVVITTLTAMCDTVLTELDNTRKRIGKKPFDVKIPDTLILNQILTHLTEAMRNDSFLNHQIANVINDFYNQ